MIIIIAEAEWSSRPRTGEQGIDRWASVIDWLAARADGTGEERKIGEFEAGNKTTGKLIILGSHPFRCKKNSNVSLICYLLISLNKRNESEHRRDTVYPLQTSWWSEESRIDFGKELGTSSLLVKWSHLLAKEWAEWGPFSIWLEWNLPLFLFKV